MMTAPWLDQLQQFSAQRPDCCSVRPEASLARCSTLRIGGPAEALLEVTQRSALKQVLEVCQRHAVPLTMVGRGANVLFPDEGLRGVVCRLAGEFARFEIEGTTVTAGAGVLMARLARSCAAQSLVGLEALAGFPASLGGAVVMNAGCYGTEVADLLLDADVLLAEKLVAVPDESDEGTAAVATVFRERRMTVAELEPGYRTTKLKGRQAIVVSARFRLARGDSVAALHRLESLNRQRWSSLPSGKPNAGSIFRNPEGDYAGRLLEEVGVKGLRMGGAAFSEKHANVIVNLGGALAAEVVQLIREAQRRVADRFGIELEVELMMQGFGDRADSDRSLVSV